MEQSAVTRSAELAPSLPRVGERPAWVRLLPSLVLAALALVTVGVQTWLALGLSSDATFLGARDSRWAITVYAAVTLCTVGLAALAPRRLLWAAVAPGALALVTTLVAVAGPGAEAWPLAVAALTLAASWLAGRTLLSAPRLRDEGLHENVLVALGVGLSVLGVAVLALGRLGLLRWWTVGLATVALGCIGALRLAAGRSPRAGLASLVTTRLRAGIAGILGLQGAFAVVWAGAPEVQFDATWYKAWLPALWASSGRIDGQTFVDHPDISIAGLAQLTAVPGHAVGAPGVGRYLQLLAGVVIVAAVWRLGARFGPAAGPLGALVVATAPLTAWEASTAYEELFFALLVVAATAGLLHYEDRPVRGQFLAALVIGLLAGTAVAGKLHLAFFAIGLGLVWLLLSESLGDAGRRLAGLLVGSVAFAAPLLLFRWLETGNPVFPYFNGLFESPHFQSADSITSFTSNGVGDHWGGWSRRLQLPWHLLRDDSALTEVAAPGILGLLVAVSLVAVFLGWRTAPARRAVWGALVLGLIAWWLEFRFLRFVFPLLVLGVIVTLPALGGVGWLLRRRAATASALAALGLAAAAFFVSTAATFWNVPGGMPLAVAVGKEGESDYERRTILDAAAFFTLNRLAEKGDKVTGNVFARTLLRGDIELTPDREVKDWLVLQGTFTSDPEQLRAILEARGIKWVVEADQQRLLDIDTDYIANFVRTHGQIVYADHLRDLYRIVDRPSPPIRAPLCDETFVKPECWVSFAPLDRTPGLTDRDAHRLPVGQTVPACPGATYALTVVTAAGREPTAVFFTFDLPDPEQGLRYIYVPPGSIAVLHQTAPADAKTLTIVLDTLGPTAQVDRVRLAVADTSLRGRPCP